MTAQFDKCRVFNFPEQGNRCIREQLMSEDISGKDKYVKRTSLERKRRRILCLKENTVPPCVALEEDSHKTEQR